MPKMNGAVFAKELVRRHPSTRVLFMSGYSGDAIVHKGILDPGIQFIGKPFNATHLSHKIRQVLDHTLEALPVDSTEVAPARTGHL
jgi:FixJ family two-component response regulator